MGRAYSENERREIAEKIWDKEARRLQKTRKTTSKMGGMCEKRSKKGRGGRKVERKCQRQWAMEKIMKKAVRRSDNWPGWPLRKGNRRTNKKMVLTSWAEGMWQHVHRHIPFRLHHSRWRGPPVACRTAEDGPHNTPAHPSVASYKQRQREHQRPSPCYGMQRRRRTDEKNNQHHN